MSSPSPAEQWTPEQRGRALHFIVVLANTPPDDWRSKKEIHEALAEFRSVWATECPKYPGCKCDDICLAQPSQNGGSPNG